MIGINRKDIRAVLFYFHRMALVKEQFVILVRKSDEYIFQRFVVKCGQIKKIECERECYAMHSSGINSLAVAL